MEIEFRKDEKWISIHLPLIQILESQGLIYMGVFIGWAGLGP